MKHILFNPGSASPSSDVGLLVLRVGLMGTLLALHGWGKLDRFFSGVSKFPDPLGIGGRATLGLAAFAEGLCAMSVLIGFATRLAVLPVIATMAVAFFIYHAGDSFGDKELALIYLVGSLGVLLTGPGRLSIDRILYERR